MAFCGQCGTNINSERFCPQCGTANPLADTPAATAPGAMPAASPTAAPAAMPAAASQFAVTATAAPQFAAAAPTAAPQFAATATAAQQFTPGASAAAVPTSVAAMAAGVAVTGGVAVTKKAPLAAIVAVVAAVVLVGGGALALALGFNPFGGSQPKEALSALYTGTDNLLFNTQSASVRFSGDYLPSDVTVKWQLGKDLKSSSFLLTYQSETILIMNDRAYVYYQDYDEAYEATSGSYVDELNRQWAQTYKTPFDANRIVHDGYIDYAYLKSVGDQVEEEQNAQYIKVLGVGPSDGASDIWEKELKDFIQNYLAKDENFRQVYTNAVTSQVEGGVRYDSTIDIVGLYKVFANYLDEPSIYNGTGILAGVGGQSIRDAFRQVDLALDINLVTTLKNSVLAEARADINLKYDGQRQSLHYNLSVTGINATNLADDSLVKRILEAARSQNW